MDSDTKVHINFDEISECAVCHGPVSDCECCYEALYCPVCKQLIDGNGDYEEGINTCQHVIVYGGDWLDEPEWEDTEYKNLFDKYCSDNNYDNYWEAFEPFANKYKLKYYSFESGPAQFTDTTFYLFKNKD